MAEHAVLMDQQEQLAREVAHERLVKRLRKVSDGPAKETLMGRYTTKNNQVEPVVQVEERHLDRCSNCNVEYKRNFQTSMLKCTKCHVVIQCLHFMSRDHDNQLPRPASKAMPRKSKPERHAKSTLYRSYLMQLHEGTRDPPREVMSILTRDSMRRHLYDNDTMCKKYVVDALRGKSDTGVNYADYTYMTSRIIRTMEGHADIPRLSGELIDRLVDRYEKIMSIYFELNEGRKPKTPALAACTVAFLQLEGEHDLIRKMRYNKGRDTMLKSERTIRDLCARAQERHPSQNWRVRRMV